jgi:alpha-glucosidase
MRKDKQKYVDVSLAKGGVLRAEPVTSHIFRVRLRPDAQFQEPSLIRYGIVRSDWEPVEFSVEDQDASRTVHTEDASLSISKEDGRVALRDSEGQMLLQEASAPRSSPESGFNAEFELREGEKLYGLGDETRDRIQKRGHRTQMWVKNVACYVPIPFLMSTGGWGLFLNTTWRHFFDLGYSQKDRLRFWSKQGELDYYLIAGETLPIVLDRYTDIVGKPHLLPLWGYGLTFVCNQQANAREMLDDCLNFRREGIPCDLVGLEPGWMEKNYDFSVEKKWHPERFYIPHWSAKGPHTFLGAAERLGFKVSLWLCCDYDLSFAEEAVIPQERDSVERHPDDFEQDQHFGHNPLRMDKITRPEEPWFDHLRKFVDQGVSAFKMDGANQVNEHPDRKWGNGMDDEEMHNLYPTLLSKQMSLGFREHTGRRAMIYSSGGYTGIQKYSATWAGDTGGGPRPLASMLNHGLSGHSNTSCDMDVFTPAGIHFGFLMPWSQLCSWAYWRHPWLLGDKLLPILKYYTRLRYRLLPYIYSTAHVASRTGMPIMRSMNLMFPDDPKCGNCMGQYMFGDFFLAGAFTDRVYLPEGRWIDYWTGKSYDGKQELVCQVPDDRGGPLFIRAGAIIPHWPDMDYVGQKPVDTISLHVYPEGESSFILYEDDGITYNYLEGAVTVTEITCRATEREVALTIAPRVGSYEGMPETRSFDIYLHSETAPAKVLLNGDPLSSSDWHCDEDAGVIRLAASEDPDRAESVVVLCSYEW